MTTPLDEAIRESYRRFNLPADRIVADPELAASFASDVGARLPKGEAYSTEEINWHLLTLRKLGEEKGGLPRLERDYNGRRARRAG